ncbi:hypothetical protein OPT61_g7940 [Boeremia exigua]|uniref:Uncharacterized protein n=1 Tax=Boeremia exigua TaxID=749465 RepID=A0ACC2I072_9PLEO|nr:hypothetical protein OPT61_g7940 [Boeremia exigua]
MLANDMADLVSDLFRFRPHPTILLMAVPKSSNSRQSDVPAPLQIHLSHHTRLPPDTTTRTNTMSDNGSPAQKPEDAGPSEHLNIKVTDNNNEVFFKIKRTTQLGKLMNAFCDRQGKNIQSVRFLFEGTRVGPTDNPDTLDMQDGDTLEVHQEQIGGSW